MDRNTELSIQRFGQDGWFFVTSPQMPGFCIFAPTLQEVKRRLKGTVELVVRAEAERIAASVTRPVKTDWHPVSAEELVAA